MGVYLAGATEKGIAWAVNSGTRVLTSALTTSLLYIRNLDGQRKIPIGKIFLGGSQAAHWTIRVNVDLDSGAALANQLAVQNLDASWAGNFGSGRPLNGVFRGGNDGGLANGGIVILHYWTISFQTLPIELDGAIRLGEDDNIEIRCEPNVDGTFSANVFLWQRQEGPEEGAQWV